MQQGKRGGDEAVPAFDTLPPERQEKILVELYTRLSGAAPVIPEPAEVAADLPRKEAKAQAAQARIAWLEQECRARAKASPADLDQLAQQRGTAVQDAVLTDTGMAPDRVFLARDGKVGANGQQVRFELAIE